MDDLFHEQLKTIRNLVEIVAILANLGRDELLPTTLELLLIEVQDIVDDYCVERTDIG